MKKNNQQFNIVLSGVGGQGLITLGNIIAEAGFGAVYPVWRRAA